MTGRRAGRPGRTPAGRAARRALADGALLLLAAILVLAALTALTLSREESLDGDDSGHGLASVGDCARYGPVSGDGFGFWWRCEVVVRWVDGGADRFETDGSLFTPDDRGREIEVVGVVRSGGRGNLDPSAGLVRPDRPARPGLLVVGVAALLAGGIAGLRPVADLGRLAWRGVRRLLRR